MDEFDFGLNLDGLHLDSFFEEATPKEEKVKEERKVAACHRFGHRQLSRKATSEKALEDAMDWHFEEGDCYHCFSFGDVDSLSYFKHILRQQKIKYAAISTWCMAGEDVADLERWHDRGMLGRVDFYVGEIFTGSYPDVYDLAAQLCRKCGGRIVVFRNHAKVMIIQGERFDCLIESSANVNTNPRSENTVVTVDKKLVSAYIELFAGITPFNKDFLGVEPYRGD